MSLAFRVLLLFSFLQLIVVTPTQSKPTAAPLTSASPQAPALQEEDPENFEIEFLVPAIAALPTIEPSRPLALDPPAPQSFTPEGERPKPRV